MTILLWLGAGHSTSRTRSLAPCGACGRPRRESSADGGATKEFRLTQSVFGAARMAGRAVTKCDPRPGEPLTRTPANTPNLDSYRPVQTGAASIDLASWSAQ